MLKSWAVPKGPTLDPGEKRLAMMVEDHPLEYGDFEGVIPAGNYGAGSVMLWDAGSYELLGDASAEEQLARGDFKFRLKGQKVRGEFALVKIKGGRRGNKGNEWLLLKKRDDAAEPGWDTEAHAWSVKSGRTQQEIADGVDPSEDPGGGDFVALKFPKGARKAPMPEKLQPMLAEIGRGDPPGSRSMAVGSEVGRGAVALLH